MVQPIPLRTTVIGSYPFPGWLEFAAQHPERFSAADREELAWDAVTVAVADQQAAGLDVISDGEQGRFDFNLSFYGFLDGIDPVPQSSRQLGPSAHDQRGTHPIVGPIDAPDGLGTIVEYERLKAITAGTVQLKMSLPGPYTLAGRLQPNAQYPDRYAVTEALVPLVREELSRLVAAGCEEITLDEPSMSCYAWREDVARLVDIFNRTVEPIVGSCRLSTHLCFGNYRGRAVARRQYAPMFPAFLDLDVDEIHLEMASREFSELDLIAQISQEKDVAVGIVDVKNYYIETPEDIAERIDRCLQYVSADRLALAPDCGLSQTARWAAREKICNLVEGTRRVRDRLGVRDP